MNVKNVAASLHVSTREVERMAERSILPARKVKGAWQFRTAEVWNWIERNLEALSERRRKDRYPESRGDLLVSTSLRESGVVVDLVAKTKSSVLRELASLAATVDPYADQVVLAKELLAREQQSSTALQDGVAIPHPAAPMYSEGVILAAARTSQGIVFGERGGGLTDLFFLVCCPEQSDHLLYLGRLCRLLVDNNLQADLREASTASEFIDALYKAENALCAAE